MELPFKFTGTNGAARILKASPPTVHSLVDRGELPCERTETGRRIFRVKDVVALAEKRAEIPKASR